MTTGFTSKTYGTLSWTWIGGDNGTDSPGSYGVLNQTSAGTAPGGRVGAATWVGGSNLIYLFGGYGFANSSSGFLQDLWYFNLSSLEWTWIGGSSATDQAGISGTFRQGSPYNIPGGRTASAYWQSDDQHFWLFGGFGRGANSVGGDLNDLWLYNPSSANWTWVSGNDSVNVAPVYGPPGGYGPSYNPGARDSMAHWTGTNGLFWIFGGSNSDGNIL